MRDRLLIPAASVALAVSVGAAGFAAADSIANPGPTADAEPAVENGELAVAAEEPTPAAEEPAIPRAAQVEAVMEHRQGVMSAVGGHMSAMAAVLIDGAPYEDRLPSHGAAVSGLLQDIPELFPEGSTHEDSDARPEIWEDAATFQERAEAAAQAAQALHEAIQGGNAMEMTQAFAGLGDTCGACHDAFRY